jgi:hypothetical protein
MKSIEDRVVYQDLHRRLSSLREDSPALWGKMSVHQMVCHLSDSFLGVMGRREISAASGPFQRTVMKWGALYLPIEWPKGVPTRPEVDQCISGTRPIEFASDRARTLGLLKEFAAAGKIMDRRPHPIFGPMSKAQWQRWGFLHTDHHLRQFGA